MSKTKQKEAATGELVEGLVQLIKRLHSMKQTLSAVHKDRAAYEPLHKLFANGPQRAADLAEHLQMDPSTMSRHVAFLIERGFVRRIPDPKDGRASLLEVTDEGQTLCSDIRARRNAVVADVLDSWDEPELRQLIAMIDRLNNDLDTHHPTIVSRLLAEFANPSHN
jgi:DNA-binding MarR family transcriptional regulator